MILQSSPRGLQDVDEVIRVVTGAGLAKPVARLRPMGVIKG
ncbi:MAG: RtcB family protein [Bryobacterales bacterium]|nr:RtcB family protein [Bryobacterales bacterium]